MEALFGGLPQPESLGYQAALDAGLAAADAGVPRVAVPYLEHAVGLRATQVALVVLGGQLRDLGQPTEAEERYRQALSAAGSSRAHALVGLAAVLCDERRFEEAFELCREALEIQPSAPAHLVAARCIDEFVATLERGNVADEHLAAARASAASHRRDAHELETEPAEERLRRRREAALPLHLIVPPETDRGIPVDQELEPRPVDEVAPVAVPERVGWLRRLLRKFSGS